MDLKEKEIDLAELIYIRHKGNRDMAFLKAEIKDIAESISGLTEKKQMLETKLKQYDGIDGKIDALILELADLKKQNT